MGKRGSAKASPQAQAEQLEQTAGSDRILVSLGGYDGQVSGYDVAEQQFVFGYTTHLGCVRDLHAFGKILVSASSDDTCKVFDLEQRKDIGTLLAHEGAVNRVRALQRHIITGGEDGKIAFWRKADLSLLHKLQTKPVVALATDAKEKVLLSAHADNKIRMWNLADAKPVWHLALDLPLNDVIFGSEYLGLLPRDGRNVQLVHAPTSAVESITTDGFEHRVTAICFGGADQDSLLLGDAEGRVKVRPVVKRVGGNTVVRKDDHDSGSTTSSNHHESDLELLEEEDEEEDETSAIARGGSFSTNAVGRGGGDAAGRTTGRGEEFELRATPSIADTDATATAEPPSRVRFLCPLGDLVAVVLASGVVEVYNVLLGEKLLDFRVPFRCTALALSFLAEKEIRAKTEEKELPPECMEDVSEDEALEESNDQKLSGDHEHGEDVALAATGAGCSRRVTFAADDDEEEEKQEAIKSGKKKKRGSRAGRAAREAELEEIERVALKRMRATNKVARQGQASLEALSQRKVAHEKRVKKEVQKADKKRLAAHRAKEAEKAKQKRDAKDARRKDREKKREQEKEKENRAKLDGKRAAGKKLKK